MPCGLSERLGEGPCGWALSLLDSPSIGRDTDESSGQWMSLGLWCCLGQALWARWLGTELPAEHRVLALLSCFLLLPRAEAQAEGGV